MRKNLFLYLTLACFFGLIAIFVVDGYLDVYDTTYITAGEVEEKVELDSWQRLGEKDAYYVSADWGEKIFFRHEVNNRRFSSYTDDIEVTAWHSQEKLSDLVSQHMQIDAFAKRELEWVVDTAELLPGGVSSEQGYEFTVTIKRGQVERNIIVYINLRTYPSEAKLLPALHPDEAGS